MIRRWAAAVVRRGRAVSGRVLNRFRRAPALGDPRIHDDRPRDGAVRRDLRRLRWANRLSRRRVIDPSASVIVVMTTFRARIGSAHIALESIARGTRRPGRLVLVLDESEVELGIPNALRRLERRGLEIIPVPDGLGVHRKFWVLTAALERHAEPIVLSDDDQIYPREWLSTLVETERTHPGVVVANRAHRMAVVDGALTPYRSWVPFEAGGGPSHAAFSTGVSGVLLPPVLLDALRDAGTAFLTVTPTADDVWINATANVSGIRVVATRGLERDFPFIPGTQSVGLYLTNVHEDANDRQLRAAFDADAIERVRLDGIDARET